MTNKGNLCHKIATPFHAKKIGCKYLCSCPAHGKKGFIKLEERTPLTRCIPSLVKTFRFLRSVVSTSNFNTIRWADLRFVR